MCTRTGGGGVGVMGVTGVMEVTVEAVGVVVPLGRGHLGEAEFVLEHLHVLEQRLGGAWWVHGAHAQITHSNACAHEHEHDMSMSTWWVHGTV